MRSGCGLSAPAVELTLTEIKWSMALAAAERTGVSYALWSGHQPLCDSPVAPTTACDGPEQVFSTRCGPATWRSVCLEAVAQRLNRRSDAGRQGAGPDRADDGSVRLAVQISASSGPLGVRRQARHRQGCERRSQGFGTSGSPHLAKATFDVVAIDCAGLEVADRHARLRADRADPRPAMTPRARAERPLALPLPLQREGKVPLTAATSGLLGK